MSLSFPRKRMDLTPHYRWQRQFLAEGRPRLLFLKSINHLLCKNWCVKGRIMGPAAFTNCMFMISLAWEVHVPQDVVVGSGYGPNLYT